MSNVQFADNKQGYDKYYALIKNLEGIFEKVYQMNNYKLDISYYENELNRIKEEFHLKDEMLQSSTITFENFRTDFEMFTLGELNKSLEKLTNEFENNVTPIYNIYLLFQSIDKKINNKTDNDIEEVLSETFKLLDSINLISTHNNIETTTLIDRAYETIYNALLYEEVYNRHDILNHIKSLNLSTTRESLGEIIRRETKDLVEKGYITSEDIDSEFINHINEGLGYDYLSEEYLKLISSIKFSSKMSRMDETKEEEIIRLEKKIKRNNDEITSDEAYLKDHKYDYIKSIIQEVLMRSSVIGALSIPIFGTYLGYSVGKSISEKITEYATITREIDLDTQEYITEPVKEYDDKETSYVATLTIYEPWTNNPNGPGYIRKAVAYEYITPENAPSDFKITRENIEGNIREKYKFNELSNVIPENENTTDSIIHITETYQDKLDSRKSTRYILPFSIVAGILSRALGIAGFIALITNDNRRRALENLSDERREYKENIKSSKDNLEYYSEKAYELEKEKENIEKQYNIKLDTEVLKRTLKQNKPNKR